MISHPINISIILPIGGRRSKNTPLSIIIPVTRVTVRMSPARHLRACSARVARVFVDDAGALHTLTEVQGSRHERLTSFPIVLGKAIQIRQKRPVFKQLQFIIEEDVKCSRETKQLQALPRGQPFNADTFQQVADGVQANAAATSEIERVQLAVHVHVLAGARGGFLFLVYRYVLQISEPDVFAHSDTRKVARRVAHRDGVQVGARPRRRGTSSSVLLCCFFCSFLFF